MNKNYSNKLPITRIKTTYVIAHSIWWICLVSFILFCFAIFIFKWLKSVWRHPVANGHNPKQFDKKKSIPKCSRNVRSIWEMSFCPFRLRWWKLCVCFVIGPRMVLSYRICEFERSVLFISSLSFPSVKILSISMAIEKPMSISPYLLQTCYRNCVRKTGNW